MRVLLFFLIFFINKSFAFEIEIPQVAQNTIKIKKNQNEKKDLFIVQNIATKTLRVYEKGECSSCFNKLILETEMVVGEDALGYRSVLGAYKIASWHKFYMDNKGLYPSWYDPTYNDLPPVHAPVEDWMIKRGSFGWYTAKLYPNAYAQWLHGTRGWGGDKKKYILPVKNKKGETISWDSSGCTRVDNETIAYLHKIMKTGAYVIKIYAPEELLDETLNRYQDSSELNEWHYILTAQEVRKVNPKDSSRDHVLSLGLNKDFYLEEGKYVFSAKPTKRNFIDPYSAKDTIQGKFYPDIGKIKDYNHPQKLNKSGLSIPSFLLF